MGTALIVILLIVIIGIVLFSFIFLAYYFGSSSIPFIGYGVGTFTAYGLLFVGLAIMSYGMIRHRNTSENHVFEIISGSLIMLIPLGMHVGGPIWDYYAGGNKVEDLIALGIPGAGAGLLLKRYLTYLFL